MELDIFFFMYGFISIILLLIVIFILRKSRNLANIAFVGTPILFTLILIFNMINYYGQIINNFLLWFPYLIAPLGMLISSIYILEGPGFQKDQNLLTFLLGYIVVAGILSAYPNPLEYSDLTGLHAGIMHLILIIPFLVTMNNFGRIENLIPDQKRRINMLITGLGAVAMGSMLRGVEFIMMNRESEIGMAIIVVGSIMTLLAFAGVRKQEEKKIQN